MGRRPLNLTPEEVEQRRQKRLLQSRIWAFEHPEEIRQTAREYHERHKAKLNLARAERTRISNARKKAEELLL